MGFFFVFLNCISRQCYFTFCLAVSVVVSYFTAVLGNNSTITIILILFLTREAMGMGAR